MILYQYNIHVLSFIMQVSMSFYIACTVPKLASSIAVLVRTSFSSVCNSRTFRCVTVSLDGVPKSVVTGTISPCMEG